MIVTLDAKRRLTVPAALAPAEPGDLFEADFDEEEDRGARSQAEAEADGRRRSESARGATRSGSQGDLSLGPERQLSPVGPDSRDTGPVVKPESQPGKVPASAV